ncbi:FAD-binding PCMH-type domain-containing protein [Candidatus Nitrotoga sp. BS]|uniref:FAD-dependent oxidoreductase n=1 Tax=Candidatus Nitrotoga sp. BS TaxID=2890408 RepID=UPI001EF28751|nr:FAD-binding protein [Candidatus Nitrotoga sp. BS]CAH1211030.1 FAD-binding PCMH-type domain-containing protein [Candidatus Nitrotoga sp. BS]
MSQKKLEECGMDASSFIKSYVEKHKKELEKLRENAAALKFDGQWFIIGDKEYPQKRLQYATTSFEEAEVSPRIILYPAGEMDIQKAMGLCRELGMAIAVRTGGHQYCGYSSTLPVNMQIDLSQTFPLYEYDTANNVLRCGVSHPLGSWAEKNHENGIYLPMGMCAHVHLGGHVHTGGWGMVARSHGILADHVLAFDIILASGDKERIVRPEAGKTTGHNDDVYYAVLGGGKGGDFGIVTHWEFSPLRDENYPNSACYTFLWLWSEEKMKAVVRKMEQLSKLCADGTVPSDYEFMLTITGYGWINWVSDSTISELEKLGFGDDLSVPAPPLIQLWMCFTNKEGVREKFDDQWFESFAAEDVCGNPLVANRLKNTPVSEGLAQHFIMKQDREMEYPYVKRSRVTMNVPEGFAETYTERMLKIMSFSTGLCQHLVSQMQIYAGGAVAEYGKTGITSYSWRQQAFAMSHDSFYSANWFCRNERQNAEQWQKENDAVFIEKKAYADADMRVFAYTFGDRVLEEVWPFFYDSKEKYERLRSIKGKLDPNGLFSADQFSLQPL